MVPYNYRHSMSAWWNRRIARWHGKRRPASRPSGELINVPAVSLDDFIAEGAPIPRLAKIDVEGGECEVLQGGSPSFQGATATDSCRGTSRPPNRLALETEYRYGFRCIVQRENFPSCLFARPEEYHGVAEVWDAPAKVRLSSDP